ncbi:ATP-binding protein [Neomoorella mulderi]|nr:4Fe-4S binding protein [Moorella mulderi]
MKPVVETSLCNGCGKCVEVCKVKAIAIEEGKAFIEQGN